MSKENVTIDLALEPADALAVVVLARAPSGALILVRGFAPAGKSRLDVRSVEISAEGGTDNETATRMGNLLVGGVDMPDVGYKWREFTKPAPIAALDGDGTAGES